MTAVNPEPEQEGKTMDNDDKLNAFGKDGYVREGLGDAGRGIATGVAKAVLILVALFIAMFLIRWLYTEWWISQHCTLILGTRVCQ